jgi:MFS family permease
VLCETSSNLVIKRLRPSRYIAAITVGWGIVATLTGVVQSYAGLIVVRLILGALEAGLFPGMTIYLTLFCNKKELGLRVGYLFVSAAIASSLGGLLAYAIGHMDGVAGQRGWRWIMILEVRKHPVSPPDKLIAPGHTYCGPWFGCILLARR